VVSGDRAVRKGLVYVISGPSGTGKGTIREILMRNHPELNFCVSVTTRTPRPGEISGVSYVFTDREDFQGKLSRGEFLECATVYGNMYGTLRGPVDEKRDAGEDVLLEKDVQGALAIKKALPEAILIFIAPPSVGELRARIEKRGTETKRDMDVRLGFARDEIGQIENFDYVVVNYHVQEAVAVFEAIITAERHRVENQLEIIAKCLEETGLS
jgi:guanylate kinase